MTNKAFLGDTADINVSFQSFDDELPPLYEYPKVDFSSGWKDRAFAFVFWIHTVAIIIIGLVLSMPIIYFLTKAIKSDEQVHRSFDLYMKVSINVLIGAVAAGCVTSLVTFFLLQLCAARIIMCTFIISIVIEVFLGVVLLVMVHWSGCIVSFLLLFITLIFIFCVRKRIPFAEVHLQVGCAVLRSHPSLILVVLGIFIVEFLWLAFWLLMAAGVLFTLIPPDRFDTEKDTPTDTQSTHSSIIHTIIGYIILISSLCWGATTFANIVHFISACTVGRWWFGNNTEQQYTLGTSIRRAFTTNFGTICLGSLLEALLKTVRSSAEEKSRRNILTCIAVCIFRILEKIIGYMNEWAFVYAALTGQSFVRASQSFTELFKKRGWTMIINDTLIEHCLGIINLMVAITSAVTGGLIAYIFVKNLSTEEAIIAIIIAVLISSLIGSLFSSIMTAILNSCVRTIFVCFALNPAALAARHPEHLQHLTKVWHEFYPRELATSGYANHLPTFNTVTDV